MTQKVLLRLYSLILMTTLLAQGICLGIGTLQRALIVQSGTDAILTDATGTATTASAIQVDSLETLTIANFLQYEGLALAATVTTLNSIKLDTSATVTTSAVMLVDATETMTNAIAINTTMQEILMASADAYVETHITFTTSQAINNVVAVTTPTINNTYTDAHITMTTLNAVWSDMTTITPNELSISTQASALAVAAAAVKAQTPTVITNNNTIITQASQLLTKDTTIANQTKILAIPNTGGVISSPGLYRLIADTTGQISIASSNVTLMLNGYTLTAAGSTAISIGSNLSNIYIAGGNIVSTAAGTAIRTNSNVTNLTVEHLTVQQGLLGISFGANNDNILIQDVVATDCYTGINVPISNAISSLRINQCVLVGTGLASTIGIDVRSALNVPGVVITNTTIRNFRSGISISSGDGHVIQNCDVGQIQQINVPLTTGLTGIVLQGCTGATINNCVVSMLYFSIAAPSSTSVSGIAILECDKCLIENCKITDLTAANTANTAFAVGLIIQNTSTADNIFINNCLFNNIEGGVVVGIESLSLSKVTVTNSIVNRIFRTNAISNNSGSYLLQSTGPNYAFGNVSVAPGSSGGTAPIHYDPSITNVIVGSAGGQFLANFAVG